MVSLLLAFIGIGFLIFIHELGHYLVGKKVGMKVEVFSVGFGKPLYTWKYKDETWQICYLFFGGYVQFKGSDPSKVEEIEIEGGFFSVHPLKRLAAVAAGPFTNILFSLLLFSLIWALGGMQKPFSQITSLIGYVSPLSKAYEKQIRPGDEILEINDNKYSGFSAIIRATIDGTKSLHVVGNRIDYSNNVVTPFNVDLPRSKATDFLRDNFGILAPASYLYVSGEADHVATNSPALKAGVNRGDRVVWVNGEVIFSHKQLSSVINDSSLFVTAKRGTKAFTTKIPKYLIRDLRINKSLHQEFQDWSYDARVSKSLDQLFFIPYDISENLKIRSAVPFIDDTATEATVESTRISLTSPILQPGDVITSVNGIPIKSATSLMRLCQTPLVFMVVDTNIEKTPVEAFEADAYFKGTLDVESLKSIVTSLGSDRPLLSSGSLRVVPPFQPIQYGDLQYSEKIEKLKKEDREIQEKAIDLSDSSTQKRLRQEIKKRDETLVVGLSLEDLLVQYNPLPFTQMFNLASDMYANIYGLFTGSVSAKYFSGPIGVISVLQKSASKGVVDSLYWLALISLNLGVLNLLPLPILDGGHIFMSLYEYFSGKKVNPKLLERLVVPFVVILIVFTLYVTLHDILRIFGIFIE